MLTFAVYLILVGIAAAQKSPQQKANVLTATCRASCLNKFHVAGLNQNCFDTADCWMCWDTCHLLSSSYGVWGSMCSEDQLCFPGCQEACGYHRSHSSYAKPGRNEIGRFTQSLRFSYRPENDSVRVEWMRPQTTGDAIDDVDDALFEPLVYVLAIQDHAHASWQELEQTFHTNTTVRRGLLKSSSTIRLTSYDSSGKVAQVEKSYAEFDATLVSSGRLAKHRINEPEDIDAGGYTGMVRDGHRDRKFGNAPHFDESSDDRDVESSLPTLDYLNHEQQWRPTLQSLRHSTKHLGGIDAVISWTRVSHNADIRYEVEWKRVDQVAIDITGHLSTHLNVGTVTMWPNSIYEVTLRAYSFGVPRRRPLAVSRSLIVDTATQTSGAHPLVDACPGCIPVQYVVGTAVAALTFVSVASLILVRLRLSGQRGDSQPKKQQQQQKNRQKAASFKRTSVKKQLSSLGARISQGPRSPTEKHDRLLEEEPSFSFDRSSHMPEDDCNA